MFQVWHGIPEVNPPDFPASTWVRGHFSSLDYRIFKNNQANSCQFIPDNKKRPLNKGVTFH